MAEDWIMVRLRRLTRARLEAVRDSLLRAHEQGKIGLEMDTRSRVSLDQVIEILIDQREGHAARRKRAAGGAAARRREKGAGNA